VHCRKVIESFQQTANEPQIAAFTPDEPAISWRIADDNAFYVANFLDDGGYLRVLLLPDDQNALSSAQFEATIFLESGTTLSGTIAYPEHSMVGVNFGKLGSRGIDEVVGVDIEKSVNTRA
jgi:hypothetical protein